MRVADETILTALFSYASNREAAKAVGLSERAFYSRLRAPALQDKLKQEKSAMLEHAITTLTQDGWHRFILKVRPDNETALALYRSLGFTMNRNMTADCINFDIYELNC